MNLQGMFIIVGEGNFRRFFKFFLLFFILMFFQQKHHKPRTEGGLVYIHDSFQNSNLLPYGKNLKIKKKNQVGQDQTGWANIDTLRFPLNKSCLVEKNINILGPNQALYIAKKIIKIYQYVWLLGGLSNFARP